MATTPNLGLTAWESQDDFYSHSQLSGNMYIMDAHDHVEGRGRRITTDALADQAVTTPKIADGNVTTAKYGNASITSPKYAPGSVDTTALKDAAVSTTKIADQSVTGPKLADDILPIGTVIPWWRPSIATPLPSGWEVCDGHTLISTLHEFAGGGTITLPDLRNRFVLGAATGGTGTSSTTPPAIGQIGGNNNANLAHSHVVDPHSHTVNAHSHVVNAHTHTVPHNHTVAAHTHTVESHAHLVGGHTHPIPDHTHSIGHTHTVQGHQHGIPTVDNHSHTVLGGHALRQRPYEISTGSTTSRQALYASGYNTGGTDVPAGLDGAGSHNHGGLTNLGTANTDGAAPATSGGWTGSTNANGAFNTGTASPPTTAASPLTTTDAPTTTASTATTTAVSTGTSSESPTTSVGLSTADVRPNYLGLLFLIKVKR